MSKIIDMVSLAKSASKELLSLSESKKNEILRAVSNELLLKKELIKEANKKDIKNARESSLSEALIDRLTLNNERIESMADSVLQIANQKNPIGKILDGFKHQSGMQITQVSVPLGVVAMIYESRPNVTIDSAAIALKTQNALILRGSSNAINSNLCLCELFRDIGKKFGLADGFLQIIGSDKSELDELVKQDKFIDVLIPRGGAKLKDYIKNNSTIPVIQTGEGICHIYVDKSADIDDALKIIKNAKTQRPSTCNSLECLVLHESIAEKILLILLNLLENVEFRIDEKIFENFQGFDNVKKATREDFSTEFLDFILSVKVVKDIDEAILYINQNSTHHSESILSKDYNNINKFLNLIDSAVVYANASTRFSDGGEFGFGSEIGISTQKMHTRGPMGLEALTSKKYVVYGSGQIRE
ncbi:glutamate-5-semialdehyde dehydrogenase [Campylobacter pinnipediorum subsp. caledonicus]|uniref:Gamma-glutamyl phosphate reductase n=1 Tax=Campylobacter pinnipediorum subsp. caledonicus TaxID=1874362 RepID=A0A1S6U8N4_9BACT|nr:glutamate-5-semialdehyde dehydrogenase [Campylobacter pinnipediorum]AQW86379.1 glutamate-5-semialdehyde dehydrogenase [Campylobacter pinnipediorum subsp. caledonicus]AQW88032.1 glutamate-5-semialdehyde dehydrogenase [Campylobacter pinnipediorum subsp. caledonicus]